MGLLGFVERVGSQIAGGRVCTKGIRARAGGGMAGREVDAGKKR